jgi:hypothetical protein
LAEVKDLKSEIENGKQNVILNKRSVVKDLVSMNVILSKRSVVKDLVSMCSVSPDCKALHRATQILPSPAAHSG